MKIYLDLLPEDRKKQLIRKKNFRTIIEQEFFLIFPIIVFIIILGNTLLLLNIKRGSIESDNAKQNSQGQYQELDGYEKDVISVNKSIENIAKMQKNHLSWSKIIIRLIETVPDGVSISDFSTNDYKVMMVGNAPTRESLMSFKDKLGADECFAEINIPLSNLVAKENIEFQLDFLVKRTCLISE